MASQLAGLRLVGDEIKVFIDDLAKTSAKIEIALAGALADRCQNFKLSV